LRPRIFASGHDFESSIVFHLLDQLVERVSRRDLLVRRVERRLFHHLGGQRRHHVEQLLARARLLVHAGDQHEPVHQLGVRDRELEGDRRAGAVAEDVGLLDAELLHHRDRVRLHLRDREGVLLAHQRVPVALLIDQDHLSLGGERRQHLAKADLHRAERALQHDQRRAARAVDLVVDVELAGPGGAGLGGDGGGGGGRGRREGQRGEQGGEDVGPDRRVVGHGSVLSGVHPGDDRRPRGSTRPRCFS
jgi:hypothetical protein